jgi:hypothetical protein
MVPVVVERAFAVVAERSVAVALPGPFGLHHKVRRGRDADDRCLAIDATLHDSTG